MALSFDDRILGEKTDYYCSSSESEEYDSCEEFEDSPKTSDPVGGQTPALNVNGAPNTGPKGVVEDWRRFKQLEAERRDEAEKERLVLTKKLALTCRSSSRDEEERAKDAHFLEEVEGDMDAFDEEFMRLYRLKRIEELRCRTAQLRTFGRVIELDGSSFLDAIDHENPNTTIVIHIYKHGLKACMKMTECFGLLSSAFTAVKFCCLDASHVLSVNFSISGVPAILVYKDKELLGNFVRLRDEFGDEFCSTDVESFLVEHGILPDSSCDPAHSSIRDGRSYSKNEDDDDDGEDD